MAVYNICLFIFRTKHLYTLFQYMIHTVNRKEFPRQEGTKCEKPHQKQQERGNVFALRLLYELLLTLCSDSLQQPFQTARLETESLYVTLRFFF